MNKLSKTKRHDAMVCNQCEENAHQHQRSDMVILPNGDVECAYCGDKKGNISPQVGWIYPVEGKPETWPEHQQHVIVWEDRFNVKAVGAGHPGDDGKGRYRMGDAIFWSGQVEWDRHVAAGSASSWNNDPEVYKSMNRWNRWSGQGPCDFTNVVCWQPMPSAPNGFKVNP